MSTDLITPELANNEKHPTLKKMYEIMLEFKAKHNLDTVELKWGPCNSFFITPSLPESELEEISDIIDDLWGDMSTDDMMHPICGFVFNKADYVD